MERITIKTKDILLSETNYKYVDHVLFQKLKKSLEMYGQVKPINCYLNEEGNVVCFEGKNILKAALELGFETIETNVFAPNEAEVTSLHLLLNEMYFRQCDVKISEVLNNMGDNINYSLLPFTKDEVDSFIKLLNFDWAEFERKTENVGQIDMFSFDEDEGIEGDKYGSIEDIKEGDVVYSTEIELPIPELEPPTLIENTEPTTITLYPKLDEGASLEEQTENSNFENETKEQPTIENPQDKIAKALAEIDAGKTFKQVADLLPEPVETTETKIEVEKPSLILDIKEPEVIKPPTRVCVVYMNEEGLYDKIDEERYKELGMKQEIIKTGSFPDCGMFVSEQNELLTKNHTENGTEN